MRPRAWSRVWPRAWDGLRRGFRSPRVGLEIAGDAIRGVRLRPAREGWRLDAAVEVALPPGTLSPSFRSANVPDPGRFVEALREVAGRLEPRDRAVRVALPDAAAKLRLETLTALPADPAAARRLAAWHIGKVFGMPPSDLAVDLRALGAGEDGEPETMIAAAARATIREYESAFEAASLDATPLLPAPVARFNLHAAVLPGEGSAVLLTLTAERAHLWLMEGGRPTRHYSIRGGDRFDALGRDLSLAVEHLRDHLAGRKPTGLYCADPGDALRDRIPDLETLFEVFPTMLRVASVLAAPHPDAEDVPDADRFGAAIGAAAGDDFGGGTP